MMRVLKDHRYIKRSLIRVTAESKLILHSRGFGAGRVTASDPEPFGIKKKKHDESFERLLYLEIYVNGSVEIIMIKPRKLRDTLS